MTGRSREDVLARLTAAEVLLARAPVLPLEGQEAIPVATIGHHAYEGPGPCRAELFGQECGAHRDEHQVHGTG